MEKLKALVLPGAKALDRVCSGETREKIESYFYAKFNETGAELTKEEQNNMLGEVDVLFTSWGSPVLDLDSLAKAPRLKYVGHAAGTVKGRVPFEAFGKGVRVFSAAGRIAESVADWCMATLMASLRRLTFFDYGMHNGVAWPSNEITGLGLLDMPVGIVSLSSTARAFIPMLKPFNCKITAYDPYASPELAQRLGVGMASLEETMSQPVVSLHLPSLEATRGMITKKMLALIPDGGLLINSSRGSVVDEDALIDELKSGRIYAALDVFKKEPLSLDSELRNLKNVLITPHVAGGTQQGYKSLMGCVVNDVISAVEGNKQLTKFEIDSKRWDLLA